LPDVFDWIEFGAAAESIASLTAILMAPAGHGSHLKRVSNHHREFLMTKVKTLCASGALLLVGSTLALAQTITPPTDGSHPNLVTQPDLRATEPSPPVAAAPSTREGLPASRVDIKSAVRQQIEDAGYYSIYGITPSFDGYHARAMESGQRVTVDVDSNGNVRRVSNQKD
jgi:hypothetical protein